MFREKPLSEEAEAIFQEWREVYPLDDKLIPVDGIYWQGFPRLICYRKGDPLPWTVLYKGNSSCFRTKPEAALFFLADETVTLPDRKKLRQERRSGK